MFKVCRHGLRYQKPDFLSPVFWRTGCPVQSKIETVSKRQPYGKNIPLWYFSQQKTQCTLQSSWARWCLQNYSIYHVKRPFSQKIFSCLRWVMQYPDKDPLMSCPVGLAPTLPSQLFVSYTITTVDMWNVEKYCFSSHSTITTITILFLGYVYAIKELSTI